MSSNYAVVFRTDSEDAPSETFCKKEDLTEIILHPSDDADVTESNKPVFYVNGRTETGEHISGDVFPVLSDGTAVVELPDGDYTITNLNSGLTTDITVNKDNSGNGAGNGAGGTQGNDVTDVSGTPVVEAQPEQVNRINVKTPDGTVILTDDTTGSAEDLNPDSLDGKVDVLDVVTAQKYLHQDKKLKFGVENYIAMDVHGDGIPNIYDFVTLKQMLLK